VEYSSIGVSIIVRCESAAEHNILCSNCTSALDEAKKQLRRSGKTLITKTSEGLIGVADPGSYKIKNGI